MDTDFIEWYVSDGTTHYVGSKTLPYFGSGGVLTPDLRSSYLVYALTDGRVRASKGAASTVQLTGAAARPAWSTASTQTLAQGVQASVALAAPGAVTFSVSSGALCPGLTLSSAGLVSGSPTATGSYVATIRAHGAVIGLYADRVFTFTIVALPVWTTPAGALTAASRNAAYSLQLAATNAASYTLVSGAVPVGTALTPLGLLSGTPTVASSYVFTVRAIGAVGPAYVDRGFSIVVS